MKVLGILLIFGFFGVNKGIESNLYMNIGQTFSCFEQHGVDFGVLALAHPTMESIIEAVTPQKMNCIMACLVIKKFTSEKAIISNIIDNLNKVDTKNTGLKMAQLKKYMGDKKFEITLTTRKIDECLEKVNEDECKLLTCFTLDLSPILESVLSS